jgi:RNA 3'-terminal phosphate cyclase (ATP)
MHNFTDITIDGCIGEGGGQVLRTSVTLACTLGKSLKVYNIRGKREKPGLQNQHVTSILAACQVCDAKVTGCIVGSTEITLFPGKIKSGNYEFNIGSAGSCILVLQTVVPILWFASESSTIKVKGGTHNGMSPSFDFYKNIFCPLLPVKTECELIKYGFYPSGGGEVNVKIDPNIKRISPLIISEKGMLLSRELTMVHSKATEVCTSINNQLYPECKCRPMEVQAHGKGMPVLTAYFQYSELSEMIQVYHQKDPKKTVSDFTGLVSEYQNASAPVEEHLADQLLLPLALMFGGTYKAISLSKYSKHFETNVIIIEMFLGPRINVTQVLDGFVIHVV